MSVEMMTLADGEKRSAGVKSTATPVDVREIVAWTLIDCPAASTVQFLSHSVVPYVDTVESHTEFPSKLTVYAPSEKEPPAPSTTKSDSVNPRSAPVAEKSNAGTDGACRAFRLVVGSPHAPIETNATSVANPRTDAFITEDGLKRKYVLASPPSTNAGRRSMCVPYVAPELAGVGDGHHRETSAS